MSEYLDGTGLALYDEQIKAYINSVSGNSTGVRIVTLNSAPTSSTTTYTIGATTYAFKIGDEARVRDLTNGKLENNYYIHYKLCDLVTNNNTTTAYWKVEENPTSLPANGGNASTVGGHSVDSDVPSNAVFTDTTYESKSASSGGTDVSLVTTGEKYTWNNKLDALVFNSTPSSSNKVATMADIPSSLPASDVSSWAKANSKPSYNLDEILDGTSRKIPTKVSDLSNDSGFLTSHQSLSGYATETWVSNKFDDVLGINASGISALTTALSDNDKATGILTAIAGKQDTLVFNTAYNASSNKVATMSDIPASLPANGGNAATVGGHSVATDVPANAVFTDNNTTYGLTINGITNGDSNGTSLGTIYVPTTTGTSGQVWKSNGSGGEWGTVSASVSYPNVNYTVTTKSNSSSSIADLDASVADVCIITTSANITSLSFTAGKAPAIGHSYHVIIKSDGTTKRTVVLSSGRVSDANITGGYMYYICPTTDGISGETTWVATLSTNAISCSYTEIDFLRIDETTIYVRGI